MSDQYTITLKVASPFASAGNPFIPRSGSGIPHAFITIAGPSIQTPVTVGYYPATPGQASGTGVVKNDAYYFNTVTDTVGEHPFDRTYSFQITSQQALNSLVFIAAVANNPGTYQL